MSEQTQQADDPGGPGWRDVMTRGVTQDGDMVYACDNFPLGRWVLAEPGQTVTDDDIVRRRIEPQQPSDSEPETMEQLRKRLAACEVLLAEAGGSGEQVNAELQQLQEQVTTLTQERDRYRNQLAGAIGHSKAPEAQAKLVDRLQAWLKPVLEVVADHPDHSSILAVSVMEFLPQIALRLIEE